MRYVPIALVLAFAMLAGCSADTVGIGESLDDEQVASEEPIDAEPAAPGRPSEEPQHD